MDNSKIKKRKSEDDVANFTNEGFILGSVPLPPSSLPSSPASFAFGHPQAGQPFSDHQLGFSENINNNNNSVHNNEESKNGLHNSYLKNAKQPSQAFNNYPADDEPVIFNTLSPQPYKDEFNYLSVEAQYVRSNAANTAVISNQKLFQ